VVEDLDAAEEEPIGREAPPTMPSRTAYLLAFIAVVVGGLFGGIIGYGLVDVSSADASTTSKLVATFIGSVFAAGGVGIVAVLVLRAMAEWKRNPNPRPQGPRRS
jgi:TRAP-type C4-dicarboxylate transport system permease small subunit